MFVSRISISSIFDCRNSISMHVWCRPAPSFIFSSLIESVVYWSFWYCKGFVVSTKYYHRSSSPQYRINSSGRMDKNNCCFYYFFLHILSKMDGNEEKKHGSVWLDVNDGFVLKELFKFFILCVSLKSDWIENKLLFTSLLFIDSQAYII